MMAARRRDSLATWVYSPSPVQYSQKLDSLPWRGLLMAQCLQVTSPAQGAASGALPPSEVGLSLV